MKKKIFYFLFFMDIWWYGKFLHQADPTKKGLKDIYTSAELNEMIIVSFEEDIKIRKYAAFDTYIDFYRYVEKCTDSKRRFHEMTLEYKQQKPRFDIDIKLKELPPNIIDLFEFGEMIKDMVIESSIKVLQENNVLTDISKDFMIFTSHNDSKYSMHIVLNRLKHPSCGEAMGFYNKCLEISSNKEYFAKYVDNKIYSPEHSLRTLWSTKFNDNRVKHYQKYFKYFNESIEHIIEEKCRSDRHSLLSIFSNSLITFVSNCQMLPYFIEPEKSSIWDNLDDVDQKYIKEAYDKLCCSPIGNINGKNVFNEPNKIKGSSIAISRKLSSYCNVCCYDHDSKGAFLILKGQYIYFHCATKGSAKQQIGILSTYQDDILIPISERIQNLRLSGELLNESKVDWDLINTLAKRSTETFGEKLIIVPKEIDNLSTKSTFLNLKTPLDIRKESINSNQNISSNQIDKQIILQVGEPIISEVDKPIVLQLDEPMISQVDESTNSQINKQTILQVDEQIISQVDEQIISQVDEQINLQVDRTKCKSKHKPRQKQKVPINQVKTKKCIIVKNRKINNSLIQIVNDKVELPENNQLTMISRLSKLRTVEIKQRKLNNL